MSLRFLDLVWSRLESLQEKGITPEQANRELNQIARKTLLAIYGAKEIPDTVPDDAFDMRTVNLSRIYARDEAQDPAPTGGESPSCGLVLAKTRAGR